ncbi:ArsS family sensor histidine kinase [Nitratifractor sp.]
MNRHSLFFKLNLLFGVALLTTIIAGVFLWRHWRMQEHIQLRMQGRLVLREWHRNGEIPEEMLGMMGLERLRGKGQAILLARLHARFAPLKNRRHLFVLRSRSGPLIYLRDRDRELLLRPESTLWSRQWLPLGLMAGFLLILTILYLLLRRALLPLKDLEREIRAYGEGESPRGQTRYASRRDEVGTLARTFYESAGKLRHLQESRQLFLRNILHELNTPVTKGRLLAEISEESETRQMLHSIFERLSLLLEELAQIERISAAQEGLEFRPVRIVDLVDQARDRLWIEEEIPIEGGGRRILADFASLSIVFKNLIDNGIKYGRDLQIRVGEDRVEFCSIGPKLEYPLEWYTRPYSRGEARAKGFGLGLYIVREILERQGMELHYRRTGEWNIFALSPLQFAEGESGD